MRIQDQNWDPISNGQIIHRTSPSTIEFVAKIYRVDDNILTDEDWERVKLIATAPKLLAFAIQSESIFHWFADNAWGADGKTHDLFIEWDQARRIVIEEVQP